MPVIADALSVIIKDSSIRTKFIGGIDAFYDSIPNSTHCTDGEIHRVGFMTPDDNEHYTDFLERNGLVFFVNGKFIDLAIVDMQIGPTVKCPWIGFARNKFFSGQTQWKRSEELFSIVWLQNENLPYGIPANSNFEINIAFPENWTPDKAINCNNFILTEDAEKNLVVLDNDDGIKKVQNIQTGQIGFICSPKINEEDNTKRN